MPENPHHNSGSRSDHPVPVAMDDDAARHVLLSASADAAIDDLWGQQPNKIPDPFVWPHADALASSERELDAPVVDVGAAMRDAGDGEGMRRAAELVAAACASHGLFQVTGHGLDPALARAALDGAAGFFRLPLATKQRARRAPGNLTGFAAAHVDRFTSNLPWKETLSFAHRDHHRHVVVDYFTSVLGTDFKPLGDFFSDGCSIMRCNYYPACPEPERTLGTGPHCDPSALTLLLQDGDVDGLQVLAAGEWRPVRPRPGALVVNIGDTFMALSNGRYRSCLHRAVVHRERERRSLAFFLCPREDRVVRPPPRLLTAAGEHHEDIEEEDEQQQPRRYPDFTWAELAHFTQRHYRADARTLDAFACWLGAGAPTCAAATSSAACDESQADEAQGTF
ncbi:hypothetical protein HU200_024471 [Digitaria exilis]|uniref:Fe2OG dioxygenase domain-containing protein n=1 Tax=Digitaria exilis TaxID=1010633 RepID=A0A835EW28_9POAL|nr:hypothetical protein HU200_024471 [Digitaria exilis]